MARFEFKVWFRHKTLDVKIIARTELQPGDTTDAAMAKCVAALSDVVKNPDDWEVWE